MRRNSILICLILVALCTVTMSFVGCAETNKDEVTTIYTHEWESNEFTAQVPRPAHGDVQFVQHFSSGTHYAVHLENITKSESQEYIDVLKSEGYAIIQDNEEEASSGMLLTRDNVALSIAFSDNSLSIMISKQ